MCMLAPAHTNQLGGPAIVGSGWDPLSLFVQPPTPPTPLSPSEVPTSPTNTNPASHTQQLPCRCVVYLSRERARCSLADANA